MKVLIRLAQAPLARAAAAASVRRALAGRLSRSELALLRRSHGWLGTTAFIARANAVARRRALRALQGAADRTMVALGRLARDIARVGGRVLSIDLLGGSLTATIPARALARLAARRDVASVAPAPVIERFDTGVLEQTDSTGAPAWWAAGLTGGTGSADRLPASLAITDDKIQEDQPAFAGVAFERPQGEPIYADCSKLGSDCGHGTEVAGAAVSQGVASCPTATGYTCNAGDVQPTWKGVAYGVGHLLDASLESVDAITVGRFSEAAWEIGLSQTDPQTGNTLPGAADPAQVLNGSWGGTPASDDDSYMEAIDGMLYAYGLTGAWAAGNYGKTTDQLAEPCTAYNTICVGAVADAGTSSQADDQIADFSSTGPTIAGRKKPDLVAVGASSAPEGNITTARQDWQSSSSLWLADNGTSFATPQVAGAAALLVGSGITDPNAVKAILIDSATPGRATPSSPVGSAQGWVPGWGWGELDLNAALAQRQDFVTDSVLAYGVHLYRATTTATGDRATLVWQQRETDCHFNAAYCPPAYTLTHLTLGEYDASSQQLLASSASALDNVQQVQHPAAAPASEAVVYAVAAASSVAGLTAEPYALAATNQLTPLANPQPTITIAPIGGPFRQGQPVTVRATIANPSGDLTAPAVQVTLSAPVAVNITAGAPTQSLGDIATHGSATARWTISAGADGIYTFTISASTGQLYGQTFSAAATSDRFLVDSTSPTVAIDRPAASQSATTIPVGWSATDAGSGVAAYDVDVAVDGGPYIPWLPDTTLTSASYTGVDGHSYSFRARASDLLGNISTYSYGGLVTLIMPSCCGTGSGPGASQRPGHHGGLAPRLALTELHRRGAQLVVGGTIARAATGWVQITCRLQLGRQPSTLRLRARVVRGRWRLVYRLRWRHARLSAVTIRYPGDRRYAAATAFRAVSG